ncbi:MAG: hypothetical protein EBR86_05835, partial [Planctomycetia bacterium]|nr:hypothetical protein [Planctomycetia bacterium]
MMFDARQSADACSSYGVRSPAVAPTPLRTAVESAGQARVFAHWDHLDGPGRHRLVDQATTIDWTLVGELTARVRGGRLALPLATTTFDLATA